jgi:signal transduction histidine kinase/response regulator RpfG family c-di-GMP phosphodiesterase
MASDPSTKAPAAADEKVRILIVDDRPDKALSLQAVLADLNQSIVVASSGKEALRCLLQQEFAVILLDVNMPGMDGFETAALIRQRPRSETTPIIFVSAVNDTETHVSRGYSLGAVDYILTPVVPEILRAKVAVFVDLYRKTELVKRQAEERAEFIREQARRAEAEAAQERMAFLAEASKVLASSLDHQEILDRLAHLLIPRLADYCIVDIMDKDGALRSLAVAHRDPAFEPRLRAIRESCPVKMAGSHGVARVYQTGEAALHDGADEAFLQEFSCCDEHLATLRELGYSGAIVVPLAGRARTLGTLSLIATQPGHAYGPPDLSLAVAFAQRAALALENAGLYKAAQQARAEAERANLAKDQFLAMLSHELRTPLTPVLTTILNLEADEHLSSEARAGLQMIRRNVELEARLIDDLLDLTRISKGKVQLHLETVDAHALLRHALEICDPDIAAKKLTAEMDTGAEHFHLSGDSARLQQIFWNLLKNAVKFTPAGGRVIISTRNAQPGELEVAVQDTGLGIEPELLPRVFDAFEQGERMRHGGLGLGLAITKALVGLHGGRIVAESEGRDRGAKFTLVFPTTEPPAAPRTEKALARPRHRRQLRILLTEDHEDTNRSLTRLLRRRGYLVKSAHDVRTAVELAQEGEFDVLISDMGLPDGSGLDLMEKLSAARAPFFGIALSGFGMESDIRKSRAAGFHHHLIKPVDLNKLDAILQQAAADATHGSELPT